MSKIVEETGKQVGSFIEVMKAQPLSLALVVMNLLLLIFLFYGSSTTLSQRRDTVDLIVTWQRETDKLMAQCVSKDILEIVVTALERDRELYRSMLAPPTAKPQHDIPLPRARPPEDELRKSSLTNPEEGNVPDGKRHEREPTEPQQPKPEPGTTGATDPGAATEPKPEPQSQSEQPQQP